MKLTLTKNEFTAIENTLVEIISNIDGISVEEKMKAIEELHNKENFSSKAVQISFNNESKYNYFTFIMKERYTVEFMNLTKSISVSIVKFVFSVISMLKLLFGSIEGEVKEFYNKYKNDFTQFTHTAKKPDKEKQSSKGLHVTLRDPFIYSETDYGTLKIVNYLGDDRNIVVPCTFNNQLVTEIGKNVFKDDDHVRTVYIPDTILKIDEGNFEGCKFLEKVYIPNSIKNKFENTFKGINFLVYDKKQ